MPNLSITRVTCRWDNQFGAEPGWYCEAWNGDVLVADSQKIWFPVMVEDYDQHASAALVAALKAEFPNAEIYRWDCG